MSIAAASFLIDGSGLESSGLFRFFRDQAGIQAVVGPYGLLLGGLAFRVDESWAQAFIPPVTGWTLAFTPPSTTWTVAF